MADGRVSLYATVALRDHVGAAGVYFWASGNGGAARVEQLCLDVYRLEERSGVQARIIRDAVNASFVTRNDAGISNSAGASSATNKRGGAGPAGTRRRAITLFRADSAFLTGRVFRSILDFVENGGSRRVRRKRGFVNVS